MFSQPPIVCTDSTTSVFKYFDFSLAPELLNYSYTFIAFIAILLGSFILFRSKTKLGLLFFLQTLFFTLFIISEIIQWVIIPAGITHFAYSTSLLLQTLILYFTFYFVYTFVQKKDLPILGKFTLALLAVPIIVLLPTKLNIEGIILESCTGVTGLLWTYFYCLEVFIAVYFLVWGLITIFQYLRNKDVHLIASSYLLFSSSLFLFIFFFSYFYADITGIYEINLLGPLGMLSFLGMLAFLIVRYHTFNIKLLGAQALITTLILLIGSQYFYTHTVTSHILTTITFSLAILFGYFLVRSVKKEVKQREEIERLAKGLEIANDRLKQLDKMKSEFVSIASHQLRSPLTSIRGYASMLVEGSYGKLPQKAYEVAERIEDSAKYMALSVEDYLNVSRIEAGNMKYEYSDFNLKELVEKITDELRPTALKKGLVMVFRSSCDGSCHVHADIGKTRQIIMNIVDNSMKYTKKGTITVVAHDDPKAKKMLLTIQDTGVGMSSATQEEVFEKFVRAKNANSVNVTGTGLGLYVAKKMITDMGGRIWAESEGEGKGSSFHIEFPLLPGTSPKR